jgi:pSer/pThr/pTyr-binding forkhead associated (FHA) protein
MYQLYDENRKLGYALTGLIKEIGRSEECDIAFPEDTSVSRVHARLDRDGEDWLVVDLGSTNGTFVNGERVAEARLQPGDMIEIGDAKLRFLPLQISDRPVRKKTTNVTLRKSEVDATRPDTSKGLFGRVKTALKKKD